MVKKDLNTLLATKILKKIKSSWVFLPEMAACRKDFDATKYVSFFVKDDKSLKK